MEWRGRSRTIWRRVANPISPFIAPWSDASRNLVLRNLIGTIETALSASFLLTTRLMENQAKTLSVHKAVLESVRVRDTAGARSAMNRLLDLAEEDYRRLA